MRMRVPAQRHSALRCTGGYAGGASGFGGSAQPTSKSSGANRINRVMGELAPLAVPARRDRKRLYCCKCKKVPFLFDTTMSSFLSPLTSATVNCVPTPESLSIS